MAKSRKTYDTSRIPMTIYINHDLKKEVENYARENELYFYEAFSELVTTGLKNQKSK